MGEPRSTLEVLLQQLPPSMFQHLQHQYLTPSTFFPHLTLQMPQLQPSPPTSMWISPPSTAPSSPHSLSSPPATTLPTPRTTLLGPRTLPHSFTPWESFTPLDTFTSPPPDTFIPPDSFTPPAPPTTPRPSRMTPREDWTTLPGQRPLSHSFTPPHLFIPPALPTLQASPSIPMPSTRLPSPSVPPYPPQNFLRTATQVGGSPPSVFEDPEWLEKALGGVSKCAYVMLRCALVCNRIEYYAQCVPPASPAPC
jgi:hypothetical protein